MSRIFAKIKAEVWGVIPAIIFFLIAFNLITFTDNLILRQTQAQYISYTLASIAALLVGKFLIIVNNFPFINAFPNRPLIYNIVWKFFIYGSFAILFRVIEKIVDLSLRFKASGIVYQHMQVLIQSPKFWAVNIWLLILFFIYCVACEFISVFGQKEIKDILFRDGKKGSQKISK